MRTRAGVLALCAVAWALGCDGDGPKSPDDLRLSIESDAIENGELAVPKNKSLLVGVVARNASGAVADPNPKFANWTVDNAAVLTIERYDATAGITGNRDVFDTVPDDGPPTTSEPAAVLTVSASDLRVSIAVKAVINMEGAWFVTADDGTVLVLNLKQLGRTIMSTGIPVQGKITGNVLELSQGGVSLVGVLASRNSASGTYSLPGGKQGNWTAARK